MRKCTFCENPLLVTGKCGTLGCPCEGLPLQRTPFTKRRRRILEWSIVLPIAAACLALLYHFRDVDETTYRPPAYLEFEWGTDEKPVCPTDYSLEALDEEMHRYSCRLDTPAAIREAR